MNAPDPDDLQVELRSPARPLHLRPRYLLLVFAGGTLGTAARAALSLALPASGGIPWTILAINVLGAFVLGFLLDDLNRLGPDEGWRRRVRLFGGTGFMGGFTTYSALATDSASLIGSAEPGLTAAGIFYALATILVGAAASWAGIALAGYRHRIWGRRTV
ncbi:CrcB family protein [Brevibacterium sp. 50QC2O2]|jgi:CrcB protein|uniref:fluoride efflux transporter FluC n=1 Tax=Brevibacterium TaxID=1696 RepID=UPI00211BB90C|nr:MULTISPECIES: CrcB family protein [unclassified Brevibacterium]MCQ9368448.1 CrcB family protein [Brevibacterium sp. 91QC2O2]MCQ9385972.1 CrcB family protein [Brevibacterium sp. 68QC2CO]MCQ9387362.1 CrcB family protein [Brevibacterium sp. 50QC2O2]